MQANDNDHGCFEVFKADKNAMTVVFSFSYEDEEERLRMFLHLSFIDLMTPCQREASTSEVSGNL